MSKEPVLTKKDCVKGACRWSLMAVTTFNYDTQLAPAVVFGIGPLLRKIYPDDDDYVAALNNHFRYFNTHPWIANLVLGATLALEDKEGISASECGSEHQGQPDGSPGRCGRYPDLDPASHNPRLHRRLYGIGRQSGWNHPVASDQCGIYHHPHPADVDWLQRRHQTDH